jgi:acetyl-CoA carboxylase biotin carboxyl carrier protein
MEGARANWALSIYLICVIILTSLFGIRQAVALTKPQICLLEEMNVRTMYKLSEIKELMKLVDSTSIQHLEIENENGKISIRKPDVPAASVPHASAAAVQQHSYIAAQPAPAAPQAVPAQAAQPEVKAELAANENLHRIVSPMVGTFYAAPSPEAPDFVKAGDTVKEKSVVCIIEAMKLMNEIEAEVNGQIVEVLAENGQLVEYGQPLFLVKR